MRTPHFELTLAPFEKGGQVAVREHGRHLLVTDDELLTSVVFEVRAESATAYPELAGLAGPEDLIAEPPAGAQCRWIEVAGIQWVRCDTMEFPSTVAHYRVAEGLVYSVSFNSDTSAANGQALSLMFNSLHIDGGTDDR